LTSSSRLHHLLIFLLLGGLRATVLPAQQTRPTAQPRAGSGHPAASSIWKSQTTGREYRVRADKEVFNADWVNIPAEAAKQVGTSQIRLPCQKPGNTQEKALNMCSMTLRFEVDSISPERITGRAESLRDFDCQKCEVRQTGWGNFVWVPKK
jgi:formate-dependent nitrite reductase cytochrome c552 subunit